MRLTWPSSFFSPISFFYKSSHAIALQTVLAEHSCSLFPFFGCNLSTALHPVLVDGHSSFAILLTDSGMIRCTSLCPSTSDGHDVLHGAIYMQIDEFSLDFLHNNLKMVMLMHLQSTFSEIPSLFDAHTSICRPCPCFLSQTAQLLP